METNSENGTPNTPTTPDTTSPKVEPTPAQPNPQNVGTEKSEKFKYDFIKLCDDCGQHGKVYLTGEEGGHLLDNFNDVTRIRNMMDDEAAEMFMNDIAQYQSEGKLGQLLSPQEEEASAQRRRVERDLVAKLKSASQELLALHDERVDLAVRSFSSFMLGQTVIGCLAEELNDNPELHPIFKELSARNLKIRISVGPDPDSEYGEDPAAVQVIDPSYLIGPDVSHEMAELDALEEKLVNESRRLKREADKLMRQRQQPKKK